MKSIVSGIIGISFAAFAGSAAADYNPVNLPSTYNVGIQFTSRDNVSAVNSDISASYNSPNGPTVVSLSGVAKGDLAHGVATTHVTGASNSDHPGTSSISAFSNVLIYMKVVGPDGPVDVDYFATLALFTDSRYVGAGAEWKITRSGSADISARDAITCNFESQNECTNSGAISKTQGTMTLQTTILYELRLLSGVALNAEYLELQPLGGYSGYATAIADPYFKISSSQQNAGAYSLSFSDGFLNVPTTTVPEPSTWLMLLCGFFGVGAMSRRSPLLRV
jgi:hypothetical protein